MTNPRDPDGSTRITGPSSSGTSSTSARHTPTAAGHEVTGRMAGTSTTPDHTTSTTTRPAGGLGTHKTSAAAAFALVFGLAALFCALTAILSPAAVLFGLIGLVLGIVGMKMSKRPGVTGRGVAIGGLVTAVLGLLIGGAVIGGAAALVNSDSQLDRLTSQIDKLKDNVPSSSEVQETVENSTGQ